ncbi:RDD family protein [Rhodobacterales bacterium HKCCE3408]|nr:RDD family protein [Rhodobacterales bacterium HKCCE3408]
MTMTRTLPDPIHQAEFYSGVPFKRLLAWLFDTIVVIAITLILGLLTIGLLWLFFVPTLFVISFFYRWIGLTNRSATPGMRLMAIEIRNGAGLRLDSQEAMLHTLGYLVSSAIFPLQLVSVLMMATGARGQGLTDMILGTAAINRPG